MSARRQPSTTSLSKYARAHSTEFTNRNLDFCNAFWGLGDGGVDVLFARMRGAMRTVEELRNFWKERAMIEEQYAKRLASLAKYTLGRDEIGDMRTSLDTLRVETEKQASYHLQVSQSIKAELEGQANTFLNKQLQHKRTYQATIEKEFKTKQTQEGYVNKAKEKYENDCIRINSYTAQSTLMQGKDLERIQLKLERAQQTVHANERDFANFARALQETVAKWEVDWKAFCDSCQDLEEDRLEFMKDNLWSYANAVSTVCVADDESCEKIRLALEQLEPEKDMENFVRDYGTGNAIPDPPQFVNYSDPNVNPAQRASSRPASFSRASQRPRLPPMSSSPPPPEPEGEPVNTAGIGAGINRRNESADAARGRSRSQSRAQAQAQAPLPYDAQNGMSNGIIHASPQNQPVSMPQTRAADPHAEPIPPTHTTMLKVGERAYPVDLSNDPQGRPSVMNGHSPANSIVGQQNDPLAQQMEQLRASAPSANSMRRGQQQPQQIQQAQPNGQVGSHRDSSAKLSPPPGSRGGGPPNRDYRRSAEFIVGGPPPSASRPTSPNPPTASFMKPPSTAPSTDVQNVLADYQQSFPGEHKSVSRPGSRASYADQPPQGRPVSMEGHAGIGAQGRSPSPQPFMPPSRGASPAVQPHPNQQQQQQQQQPQQQQQQQQVQQIRRNSFRAPNNNAPPTNGVQVPRSPVRGNSISVPQMPPQQQRPTSPNSVGIALAADGGVAMDVMRDRYQQQQQSAPIPQQPTQQSVYRPPVQQQQPPPPPPQQPQHQYQQRTPSYGIPPQTQPPYAAPAYQASYTQQPPPQPTTVPGQIQNYGVRPGPTPYQPQNQMYQPPPPQHQVDYGQQALVSKGGLVGNTGQGYYGNGQQMVHQQQPQQMVPYGRAPSPMRQPSPQPPRQNQPPPTGQYTEDGRGVLFYVKALYDYQAVIDEEFDFQAGDIIAVTDTPEDGWWSGELLDEARRQFGRHVFPSNFVTLF